MTESNPELVARVERFSLLRAAQRVLARSMHPSAVDPLREEGREILVKLQAAGREGGAAPEEPGLRDLDRLLERHLDRTLELLGRLEFAQLRATGAELCRDKPDELRALVDLVLLGRLEDEQELRLVEYLVTMLSGEEQDGRRALTRDPSELTEALRQAGLRRAADAGVEAEAAVARLEQAAASLIRGGDHRALRDEIRGFKQELGAGILHPDILKAAVAYNVAMANQVSAHVDSTLALDELADELLSGLKGSEAGDSDLLHGDGLTRLASALRARVRGDACDDEVAAGIVAEFKLDALVAREVEALEDTEGDALNPLIVSAVVLGCVLRQRKALGASLAILGLDPEELEEGVLPALLRELGAASSKFFADDHHDEAFLISEVKTRNLAAIHDAAERRARAGEEGVSRAAGARTRWQLPFGLSPAMAGLIVGPILGLVLGATIFGSFENEVRILPPSELSEISPFLDSGHRRIEGGEPRFVGHVFPTWDYLPTPERRNAAAEVAGHFIERGVLDGVLLGVGPRVMVRWEDGEITELTPRKVD
jgi:hypothetical protein